MLKLCGFRISNYHNKVRIVLLEKGVAFEEDASCSPSQKDEFLARSPMGKVPFLELDDGRRLAESEVICEYLDEAYPQKPLLPRDPLRARQGARAGHGHGAPPRARRAQDVRLRVLRPSVWTRGQAGGGEGPREGVRALKAAGEVRPYIAGRADARRLRRLRAPAARLARKQARLGRDFLEDLRAAQAVSEDAR